MLIIGGGVCGVLAGQRCAAKGLSFRLVDEGIDFGGTWSSLANTHSQLQVGQVYLCTETRLIHVDLQSLFIPVHTSVRPYDTVSQILMTH